MIVITVANLVALAALAYLVWKRTDAPLRKFFWPGLAVKIVSGIVLGLMFTYYYTVGDTFGYLHDGQSLTHLARTDFAAYMDFLWEGDAASPIWITLVFQQPRAAFFSKIVSVFCLFCADNYWLVSLYFSFISFWGAWFLVRELGRYRAGLLAVAAVAFLFFPSVIFWTSGVIKESLAMAAFYFVSALFLRAWTRARIRPHEWILLAVSLWILWNLKYYYLAVLLPVMSTALVLKLLILPRVKIRHWSYALLLWSVVFIIPLYIASLVHPNFYPERFLNVIVENYQDFREFSQPEDMIHYDDLQPDVTSILKYAPRALYSGLFRPFVWEAHNPLQILIGVENLFLLILFLGSLSRWRSVFVRSNRLLAFSLIAYVVLLCVFLALSTPNFGTLARYRVGFISFFFLLIAYNNPVADKLLKPLRR